jgi:hypothetical protein
VYGISHTYYWENYNILIVHATRRDRNVKVSGVAVVGCLALLLRNDSVVLGALDGRSRFIEQRAATGEVAVCERVSRVLAGFDRLLMVVRTVLRTRRR